jgi:excisionase family DNA binding protein
MPDDDVIGNPRWVTVAEAHALTGWPPNYIRRLAATGELPAVRFGRAWAIDREAVVARKAKMERLGTRKHSPWRADLIAAGRGRKRKPTAKRCRRRSDDDLYTLLAGVSAPEEIARAQTEALAAQIAALCLELGLTIPDGMTARDLAERLQRGARTATGGRPSTQSEDDACPVV